MRFNSKKNHFGTLICYLVLHMSGVRGKHCPLRHSVKDKYLCRIENVAANCVQPFPQPFLSSPV
jgi:hypothetical protein